jgi:hypothetical protein
VGGIRSDLPYSDSSSRIARIWVPPPLPLYSYSYSNSHSNSQVDHLLINSAIFIFILISDLQFSRYVHLPKRLLLAPPYQPLSYKSSVRRLVSSFGLSPAVVSLPMPFWLGLGCGLRLGWCGGGCGVVRSEMRFDVVVLG